MLYNKLRDKSTTNRSSGVWAGYWCKRGRDDAEGQTGESLAVVVEACCEPAWNQPDSASLRHKLRTQTIDARGMTTFPRDSNRLAVLQYKQNNRWVAAVWATVRRVLSSRVETILHMHAASQTGDVTLTLIPQYYMQSKQLKFPP